MSSVLSSMMDSFPDPGQTDINETTAALGRPTTDEEWAAIGTELVAVRVMTPDQFERHRKRKWLDMRVLLVQLKYIMRRSDIGTNVLAVRAFLSRYSNDLVGAVGRLTIPPRGKVIGSHRDSLIDHRSQTSLLFDRDTIVETAYVIAERAQRWEINPVSLRRAKKQAKKTLRKSAAQLSYLGAFDSNMSGLRLHVESYCRDLMAQIENLVG